MCQAALRDETAVEVPPPSCAAISAYGMSEPASFLSASTPTLAADPAAQRPKLRHLEPKWIHYEGEARLFLRDPLQLSDRIALIPEALVPLLPLLDGTRDIAAMAGELTRSTGVSLPERTVAQLVSALDDAVLLEGPRLLSATNEARAAFRSLPYRDPALAGPSYPSDPEQLDLLLDSFVSGAAPASGPMRPISSASGVLSPHIDFRRGGSAYAATWARALEAVASADVVLVFGTDHWGSAGYLTVTPQRYATPWGALPTDASIVQAFSEQLGAIAHEEELHHIREHAIELAAVWLHWALRKVGRDPLALPPVVPVLCGSFHCYTRAGAAVAPGQLPEEEHRVARALDAVVRELEGRRVLVVSAADLAHVGPAFGDATALGDAEKSGIADSDAQILAAVESGDASALLAVLRAQQDRTRVCGLPPTYWAMRVLARLSGGAARGRTVRYEQCPADERLGSLVSVAGVLWE
jgi:MEMO1 family protein